MKHLMIQKGHHMGSSSCLCRCGCSFGSYAEYAHLFLVVIIQVFPQSCLELSFVVESGMEQICCFCCHKHGLTWEPSALALTHDRSASAD